MFGAVFLQATFPGIAGIYYGDEIGLKGADEPFNREPYPWDLEDTWNKDLFKYTTVLMNIKNENPILKYGRFELVESTEDFVAFRRILKDESLLCVINRDRTASNFKIKSTAHTAEVLFGNNNVKLNEGHLLIENFEDIGIIISEK